MKLVFSGVLFMGLLGLGFWQLSRYEEASQAQQQLQIALSRSPVDFSTLDHYTDLQPVKARGTYLHPLQIPLVAKTYQGRSGNVILTPFRLATGSIVMVDRGWTTSPKLIPHPEGELEIIGVIRNYPQSRGWFTPKNSKTVWHTVDYQDLQREWGTQLLPIYISISKAQQGLYPHYLYALGQRDATRHLNYALTWFSLALALVVMTFFFLRKSHT